MKGPGGREPARQGRNQGKNDKWKDKLDVARVVAFAAMQCRTNFGLVCD